MKWLALIYKLGLFHHITTGVVRMAIWTGLVHYHLTTGVVRMAIRTGLAHYHLITGVVRMAIRTGLAHYHLTRGWSGWPYEQGWPIIISPGGGQDGHTNRVGPLSFHQGWSGWRYKQGWPIIILPQGWTGWPYEQGWQDGTAANTILDNVQSSKIQNISPWDV